MKAKIFAAVALAAAMPSFAVPVQFDITGTMRQYQFSNWLTGEVRYDPAIIGQDFAMQFEFDTDAFDAGVMLETPEARTLRFNAFGDTSFAGAFTTGGVTTRMTLDRNVAQVWYTDSNGTVDTPNGPVTAIDGLTLVLYSEQQRDQGSFFSNLLLFDAYAFNFEEFIDLDDPFSPGSLSTVALPNASMSYLHQSAPCAECSGDFSESWQFDIGSITRTIRAVPEPGTLSLLAMGLLAAGFARRRAGLRSLQPGV